MKSNIILLNYTAIIQGKLWALSALAVNLGLRKTSFKLTYWRDLLGQVAARRAGRVDAHLLAGQRVGEPVGVALATAVPEARAAPLLGVEVPAHGKVLAGPWTSEGKNNVFVK